MPASRSATNATIQQYVETVHMWCLTWAGAATDARCCCSIPVRASGRFWHSWTTRSKPPTQCSESAHTILEISWKDFESNVVRSRCGVHQAKLCELGDEIYKWQVQASELAVQASELIVSHSFLELFCLRQAADRFVSSK